MCSSDLGNPARSRLSRRLSRQHESAEPAESRSQAGLPAPHRPRRDSSRWALAAAGFLWLASCTTPAPPPAKPAGVAYAGPPVLNLRKDLGPRSAVTGTAKHGERLDVLETRRRFVRVRASSGAEGWADLNLLLSQQQMDDLRRLAEDAKKLPSQGAATVYEPLNIHAEPFRQSPSFFQIPEGGVVDRKSVV